MSSVTRTMSTTPERVWGVLSDGWLVPLWVVGASRIREVDESWPKPGSRIFHSFGVWPIMINDDTEVLESEPGRLIRLRAEGQPLGAAEVTITLTAIGSDTEVKIREVAVAGPGALIPDAVLAPLLNWRNTETLRRLAFLAERRPASLLPKES